MSHPRRYRAAIAAAVLIFTAGITTAGPAKAAPPVCDGVWVVVQPEQQDPATATAKCATEFSTGTAALNSAGFTAENQGGMLTRIDGAPENTDFSSNGGFYWSYWNATVSDDGTLGGWEFYQVGADQSQPARGHAEGWLLTNDTAATGPALTAIPETPAASPSATPTTQPSPADAGSPAATIAIAAVVLVALAGIGIWWMRRRKPS